MAIRNLGMRSTFQSLHFNHDYISSSQGTLLSPSAAILGLVRSRQPELGEEVLQRGEGRGLAPVILVAVHVQNLLTGHGEHA